MFKILFNNTIQRITILFQPYFERQIKIFRSSDVFTIFLPYCITLVCSDQH